MNQQDLKDLATTAPTLRQGPNPGPAAYEIISKSFTDTFASLRQSDNTMGLFSI